MNGMRINEDDYGFFIAIDSEDEDAFHEILDTFGDYETIADNDDQEKQNQIDKLVFSWFMKFLAQKIVEFFDTRGQLPSYLLMPQCLSDDIKEKFGDSSKVFGCDTITSNNNDGYYWCEIREDSDGTNDTD